MPVDSALEFACIRTYAVFFPCSYCTTHLQSGPLTRFYIDLSHQFFVLLGCRFSVTEKTCSGPIHLPASFNE